MGLFRKITSVSTMGAVDFRSDKERTAAYGKATKKQAKQQTQIMRQQLAIQQAQAAQPHTQPGWYPDTQPGWVRWHDGHRWTEHVRHM